MALSDSTTTSLITAAAGLVGAGIGGMTTYLANRGQWRRESRRTVYANLISAAYGMESFIKSKLEHSERPGTDLSADTDPRTQFTLQLDTATLLAKGNTRNALDEWRDLFRKILNDPASVSEGELDSWQDQRNGFYEYARDELGVPGIVRHRRTCVRCSLVAILTIPAFIFLGILRSVNSPYLGPVQKTGPALFGITLALLLCAFWAARKWQKKLISLHRSSFAIVANLLFRLAILVAFILSCIAFSVNDITAIELAFFADLILIVFLSFAVLAGVHVRADSLEPLAAYQEVLQRLRSYQKRF